MAGYSTLTHGIAYSPAVGSNGFRVCARLYIDLLASICCTIAFSNSSPCWHSNLHVHASPFQTNMPHSRLLYMK